MTFKIHNETQQITSIDTFTIAINHLQIIRYTMRNIYFTQEINVN